MHDATAIQCKTLLVYPVVSGSTPERLIAGDQDFILTISDARQHGCPDFGTTMTEGNFESAPGVKLPLPVRQHTSGSQDQNWQPPACNAIAVGIRIL